VAGLGYEFIKFSGKYYHNPWARIVIAPGLWLQKLTTREPDDQQLEIALQALKAVLPIENEDAQKVSDPAMAQLGVARA
jgi:uncharacterized protein YqhQ